MEIKAFCAVAVLAAVSLAPGAEGPAARPTAPPSPTGLAVYSQATVISRGELIDVVIEVANTSPQPLRVSDCVGLERRVAPLPGQAAPPDQARRQKPDVDGVWNPVLVCGVPAGSPDLFIAPRGRGPITVVAREVKAGESLLLKVELPADAFEVGSCTLTAELSDGAEIVARSPSLSILCHEERSGRPAANAEAPR